MVLNNEEGFLEQNIRYLCDVGRSTKGKHKYGYIGTPQPPSYPIACNQNKKKTALAKKTCSIQTKMYRLYGNFIYDI